MNNLKANMLIYNDIMALKGISIDIGNKTTFVTSYKVIIIMNIKQRNLFIKKKAVVSKTLNILLQTEQLFDIKYVTLPNNQDFFFLY